MYALLIDDMSVCLSWHTAQWTPQHITAYGPSQVLSRMVLLLCEAPVSLRLVGTRDSRVGSSLL